MRYHRLLYIVLAVLLCQVSLAQAQPATIRYNEVLTGTITESNTEQNWAFDGQEGDLVLIDMRADNPNALDTLLTLLDPNGSTLITDDDSGDHLNSRIGPFQLPASGQYTIVAARYNGSGDYELELRNLNTLPTLRTGKPVSGVVDSTHVSDYFLLRGEAGATNTLLRLDVTTDDQLAPPFIAFYGSSGLITSTEFEDVRGSRIEPVVALPDQSFVVAVSWNSSGSGGPYELALNFSELALLDENAPQTGTLDFETFSNRHYFQGEADQIVRITVTTEDTIAPALDVFSNDRQYFLFSSEGEYTREVTATIQLPADGLYGIEVRDGSYGSNEATYTITVDFAAS